MVVVRPERCLFNIRCVDANLMIARTRIQLGEKVGAMELAEQLFDDRDQELVLHSHRVERPVIDAKAPRCILLADQQDRRRKGGRALPDDALLEHSVALALQLVFLEMWVAEGRTATGSVPGFRWMR